MRNRIGVIGGGIGVLSMAQLISPGNEQELHPKPTLTDSECKIFKPQTRLSSLHRDAHRSLIPKTNYSQHLKSDFLPGVRFDSENAIVEFNRNGPADISC